MRRRGKELATLPLNDVTHDGNSLTRTFLPRVPRSRYNFKAVYLVIATELAYMRDSSCAKSLCLSLIESLVKLLLSSKTSPIWSAHLSLQGFLEILGLGKPEALLRVISS